MFPIPIFPSKGLVSFYSSITSNFCRVNPFISILPEDFFESVLVISLLALEDSLIGLSFGFLETYCLRLKGISLDFDDNDFLKYAFFNDLPTILYFSMPLSAVIFISKHTNYSFSNPNKSQMFYKLDLEHF